MLILFLCIYNHSLLSFLNTQYTGAIPTFNIKALYIVINVQVLKLTETFNWSYRVHSHEYPWDRHTHMPNQFQETMQSHINQRPLSN